MVEYELHNIENLISKTLIESNMNHGEFVLINNVLREYDNLKKENKNVKTLTVPKILVYF